MFHPLIEALANLTEAAKQQRENRWVYVKAGTILNRNTGRPVAVYKRMANPTRAGKYMPHQGARECARRLRQRAA